MRLDNTRSVPLFGRAPLIRRVAAVAAALVLIVAAAPGCGRKAKPEPLRSAGGAPAAPGFPAR